MDIENSELSYRSCVLTTRHLSENQRKESFPCSLHQVSMCVCVRVFDDAFDLKAKTGKVLQGRMFCPCQSLDHLEIHVCVLVHVYVSVCVRVWLRDCAEGFCVIVLSIEACREKGHVLSSDHIVYYNHSGEGRGGRGEGGG